MLRYTLMRLGIFVGCLLVVWGAVYAGIFPRGLGSSNGLWILLLALVVSAPISWVALRRERDRASMHIVGRVDRMKRTWRRTAPRRTSPTTPRAPRARCRSAGPGRSRITLRPGPGSSKIT